jgi:type II secretory pathway pseudopilin PulG
MNRKRNYNNSAFTLLELICAAGILVFVITGTLSVFLYGFVLGNAMRNQVTAANDAQYVFEKLKDSAYADITTYTDTNFTSLQHESIRVTVTTASNVKTVVANVTWSDGPRQRSYALTTQIAQ